MKLNNIFINIYHFYRSITYEQDDEKEIKLSLARNSNIDNDCALETTTITNEQDKLIHRKLNKQSTSSEDEKSSLLLPL